MRELKFIGLNKNSEFVYGDLVHKCMTVDNKICVAGIAAHGCYPVEVDITTVGQFTGLKDVNGVEIYEGDIIRTHHFYEGDKEHFLKHIVQWSYKFSAWFLLNAQSLNENDGSVMLYQIMMKAERLKPKVIGNIHQNKDLLEG